MENSDTQADLVTKVASLEKKLEDITMLLSDVYRFGKLQELLRSGQWKEADEETTRVMLEITGKSNKEVLTPDDVKEFPTTPLKVIDNLWRNYSHDRFGFSLQLKAYLKLGGTLDTLRAQDLGMLRKLGDEVGWRQNGDWIKGDEVNFSQDLPPGFLPGNWWNSPYGAKMANFFLTRLLTSDL